MKIAAVTIVLALLVGVNANCPEIPDPEFTITTCTDGTNVGSVCQVECFFGYTLLPPSDDPLQSVIACREDDTWDKEFPFCNQTCHANATADIVFVVDVSTSLGGVTGTLMREFMRALINQWTISDDNVHVAIVPYARQVVVDRFIPFTAFENDKDGLLGSLDRLPRNRRGSLTGRALTFVGDVALAVTNGNRVAAPDIVIVMNDGRGQDRIDSPLQRLWDFGATTYAVGFHPRRRNMALLTRQLTKISQGDPRRMHLTERDEIGNANIFMESLTSVYCVAALMAPVICDVDSVPAPDNGVVLCSGEPTSLLCDFGCEPGYTIVGDQTTSCSSESGIAFWSNPTPLCVVEECTPVQDTIRHGEVECSNENKIGSSCEFSCTETGYSLYPAGRTVNTCLLTQEWDVDAPCCTLPCPPNARMDAIIVLDSSSSIGDENWITMTSFVERIIRSFTVSPEAANFGIVRYNRRVDTTSQIMLNDYPGDQEGLIDAFRRIPYDGSGTFTGNAIQHVVDNMLSVEEGNRPDFVDIVIIITDGKAADDVKTPSDALRATGGTILVIGIDPPRGALDLDQLLEIAGSSSNLIVVSGGFGQLDENFALEISELTCGNPCDR